MALFKFGKTVKHQRFNYIPRYYDPEKEEREARIKAAMGMSDTHPEAMKSRISRSFREKHRGSLKSQRGAARRSNLILIVTLITLLLLTYILLTRYLPVIEKALE
ncbi:MAG TPA: hypothetical protein VI603_12015 [Saprospiraceae bacterium]|nr:hypothetical protein [Saprospiraceae bacterium]